MPEKLCGTVGFGATLAEFGDKQNDDRSNSRKRGPHCHRPGQLLRNRPRCSCGYCHEEKPR
jgi:hypothetical protein